MICAIAAQSGAVLDPSEEMDEVDDEDASLVDEERWDTDLSMAKSFCCAVQNTQNLRLPEEALTPQ